MVTAMGRVVEEQIDQRGILLEMQDIVVQHASRILGELRDAEPKSVAKTRALLAPIDNFRARNPAGSTPRPAPVPPAAADDEASDAAPTAMDAPTDA